MNDLAEKYDELQINDKFKNLIPPLTSDELQILEESILQHGVRDPILTWNNTIIDGHNRYTICKKHNLPFQTKELEFNNELEALIYIIKNQLGRRNLTDFAKTKLSIELNQTTAELAKQNKQIAIQKANQFNPNHNNTSFCPNLDKTIEHINTGEEIAKLAGVGRGTVFKVKKIDANAVDEIKQELMKPDGKLSINAAEIISQLPAEEQKAIIQNLDEKEIIRRAKEIKEAKRAAKKEKIENISNELSEPITMDNTDDFIVNNGDIWQAGEHILICGDNTNPKIVDYLKKYKISFVFADPPYGTGKFDYDKEPFKWQNDYMTDIADVAAVTPGTISIFDFFKATNMPYKWSLACFVRNGNTHGAVGFANWIYTAIFSNLKSIHKNSQDIMDITLKPEDHDDISEGRQKPFQYLTWLIDLFSEENDYVADIFAGSGSFMLVSEKLNRKSINIEILPDLCSAILKRYALRFKKEVKKIGNLE
jgi:DNA modification methylase